jgi:hypothetical protein
VKKVSIDINKEFSIDDVQKNADLCAKKYYKYMKATYVENRSKVLPYTFPSSNITSDKITTEEVNCLVLIIGNAQDIENLTPILKDAKSSGEFKYEFICMVDKTPLLQKIHIPFGYILGFREGGVGKIYWPYSDDLAEICAGYCPKEKLKDVELTIRKKLIGNLAKECFSKNVMPYFTSEASDFYTEIPELSEEENAEIEKELNEYVQFCASVCALLRCMNETNSGELP